MGIMMMALNKNALLVTTTAFHAPDKNSISVTPVQVNFNFF